MSDNAAHREGSKKVRFLILKKVLINLKFGKAINAKFVLLKIFILYNFQIICPVLEQYYVVFQSFPLFTAIADPRFDDLGRFQFVKFSDV